MKKVLQKLYAILISILAFLSIVLLFFDLSGKISLSMYPYCVIDTCILIVFLIDYVVRFFSAKEKRKFFISNIVDLIAIIPFNSIFSAFRMFRMFRILKATKIIKFTRFLRAGAFLTIIQKRIYGILKTNGFIYILYANIAMIICASGVMMYAESMTFTDALWWSFVTCTTVGYGDISPESSIGRIVAVILMLFGIGLLGMLTGAITTYFSKDTVNNVEEKFEGKDELQNIIEEMTDDDRKKLLEIAKILVKK